MTNVLQKNSLLDLRLRLIKIDCCGLGSEGMKYLTNIMEVAQKKDKSFRISQVNKNEKIGAEETIDSIEQKPNFEMLTQSEGSSLHFNNLISEKSVRDRNSRSPLNELADKNRNSKLIEKSLKSLVLG